MEQMKMDQMLGAILIVLIGLVIALSLLMIGGLQLSRSLGATVATCPGSLCPLPPSPSSSQDLLPPYDPSGGPTISSSLCFDNYDCGLGSACVDYACEEGCVDDTDCPSGTTCDVSNPFATLGSCDSGCYAGYDYDCGSGYYCSDDGNCEALGDEVEEGGPCFLGAGGSDECDGTDPGERDMCDYYASLPGCGAGLVCKADSISDGEGGSDLSMVQGTCSEPSDPTSSEDPSPTSTSTTTPWDPSDPPLLPESPPII